MLFALAACYGQLVGIVGAWDIKRGTRGIEVAPPLDVHVAHPFVPCIRPFLSYIMLIVVCVFIWTENMKVQYTTLS